MYSFWQKRLLLLLFLNQLFLHVAWFHDRSMYSNSVDIIKLFHVNIKPKHVRSFSLQTVRRRKEQILLSSGNTWIHLKPWQFYMSWLQPWLRCMLQKSNISTSVGTDLNFTLWEYASRLSWLYILHVCVVCHIYLILLSWLMGHLLYWSGGPSYICSPQRSLCLKSSWALS